MDANEENKVVKKRSLFDDLDIFGDNEEMEWF